VWDNSTQITLHGTAVMTVNSSVVQGGYDGTDNLDTDPLFVTPISYTLAPTDAGDYHLQAVSPVINQGNNAYLPQDNYDLDGDNNTGELLPVDYDGEARVMDAKVDPGAYEVNICASYIFPYTVVTGKTTDLIQAVKCANNSDDASVINLTNGTYTLTSVSDTDGEYGNSALPRITTPITINGDGSMLQRDAAAPDFRLIRVGSTGNLTLNTIEINGGKTSTANYKVGGGILNQGTLTLTGSAIVGNTSLGGGGLYNDSGASMSITDANITGNTANSGGGLVNWGTLTIKNSLIKNNTSTFDSGGVFNGGH
jgi:hypothetical protein